MAANLEPSRIKQGKMVLKGTTNDGTTNILELTDSDNTIREKIDTNGFKSIRYRDEYPSSIWTNASGAAAPTLSPYTIGGILCNKYTFNGATTEERMANSFEIPHDLAFAEINAGTLYIEVHIHWSPSSSNTGNVEWFFDWCYRPSGAAPLTQTALSCVGTMPSNQQYFQKIDAFVDGSAIARLPIPTGGFNLGDLILFNIRRTPTGTNDTYPDAAIFDQIALHVPTNDRGSRQTYIK